MNNKIDQPTFIPKIYCKVFGHDFQVTKKVTFYVKEYTCIHCKKQLTTNSNGRLTELTPKFKEINNTLERIHYKRTKKSNNHNKKLTTTY